MECQRTTTKHIAYPVFYDVEPSEIRNQSGPVKKAFDKHKKNEAAAKWKEAMTEAASLAGWELKNSANGHEAILIEQIVHHILVELPSFNSSTERNLIDMKTGSKMLGRAFFDEISRQYAREVCKSSMSGLKSFQNLLLSDALIDKGISVKSVYNTKNMMKMMMPMPGRKVRQSTSKS